MQLSYYLQKKKTGQTTYMLDKVRIRNKKLNELSYVMKQTQNFTSIEEIQTAFQQYSPPVVPKSTHLSNA